MGLLVVVPACQAGSGAGVTVSKSVDVCVGPLALQDADDGFGLPFVCAVRASPLSS